jgi:lipid-binding SYLF domain-containing protein
MRSVRLLLSLAAASLLAAACTSPRGATVDDKRSFVREMRDDTLEQLFRANPELRERLEQAKGYAVFTNVNIHMLTIAGGDGYGIAYDARTGKETFMRMAEIGSGPGIALRDFRSVFIFRDEQALDRFLEAGWQFSLDSGATAMTTDRGASARALASVSAAGDESATVQTESTRAATEAAGQGVEVYQLTQAGLALHAAALGTRYFRDGELN